MPWSWRALGAAALISGLLLAVGFKLSAILEADHDAATWTLLPASPGNALVGIGMLTVVSLVGLATMLGFSLTVLAGRWFIPLTIAGPAVFLGLDALRGIPVEWPAAATMIIAFLIGGSVYSYLALRLSSPVPFS